MKRFWWYLLITALIVAICSIVGLCKVEFSYGQPSVNIENMAAGGSQSIMDGVYLFIGTPGAATYNGPPIYLKISTDNNIQTVTCQGIQWTPPTTPPAQNQGIVFSNSCSTIMLQPAGTDKKVTGLQQIWVTLSTQSGSSQTDFPTFVQNGGCNLATQYMPTWGVGNGITFKATGNYTTPVPVPNPLGDSLQLVRVSKDYVWGIGENGQHLYACKQPCGEGNWQHITGVAFSRMSASDKNLWTVNAAGTVYNAPLSNSNLPPLNTDFTKMPGIPGVQIMDIAASANAVYATDNLGQLYSCTGTDGGQCTGNWVNMQASRCAQDMQQISKLGIQGQMIWGINSTGNVYSSQIQADGSLGLWKTYNNFSSGLPVQEISVGKDYVWATDTQNNVYQCTNPCTPTSSWTKLSALSASQISSLN